jgi:moderate conductance mechanosensitive channel
VDIIITVTEIILLIFVFSLLNWLVAIVFKQTTKISWLQGGTEQIKTLRRTISRLLILTCGLLCLIVAGVNGFVIYQGKSVQDFQLNLIRTIPNEFWVTLATGSLKSISLLVLVKISLPSLRRFLDWACDRAKNFDQITANDESVEVFFKFLKKHLTNSIWILAVTLCTQFLQLPAIVPKYLYITLQVYLTISIGLLIVKAISAIVDTLDALNLQHSSPDNILRFYDPLRHQIPLFKKCLEYVIYVTIATLVVKEVEFIAWIANYSPQLIQIIGIFFFTNVLIEVANLTVEELFLSNKELTEIQRQRRLTIIPLVQNFLKYLIYFSAGIAILKVFSIDPTPILAGAGIVGLAVGLGAQNLINDIVCGFFILFENYYLVGDYIEVKNASGFVEAIELRTTRIRHLNGQVYIIRNGEIHDIVNYSKQYIYAVVEVGVSYDSNLDRVYEVLEEIGRQLKISYEEVLEPTRVDGLEKFGESEMLIRTVTKVKPGSKPRIQRILRKMIKDTFDREGITIPFAHQVLIFKNESDNSISKLSN